MSHKLPIFLELDEVVSMMNVASTPRDRVMVHVLYKTGLRVHELTSLKIEDLDFNKRQLMVRSGKGDKDRFVDFDGELAEDVNSYIGHRSSGILFPSTHRRCLANPRTVLRMAKGYRKSVKLEPGQMSDSTVQRIIQDLARRAGIRKAKPITPHVLRHTYACHSLLAGVAITSLQRSLGHSSISTTQVYLEAVQSREHVKRDYETHPLPPIGKGN